MICDRAERSQSFKAGLISMSLHINVDMVGHDSTGATVYLL